MGTRTKLLLRSLVLGGGKRDRTADLLHAMQALSQLSYTPFVMLLGIPRWCREMDYRQIFRPFSSALKLFAFRTKTRLHPRMASVLYPSPRLALAWPIEAFSDHVLSRPL